MNNIKKLATKIFILWMGVFLGAIFYYVLISNGGFYSVESPIKMGFMLFAFVVYVPSMLVIFDGLIRLLKYKTLIVLILLPFPALMIVVIILAPIILLIYWTYEILMAYKSNQ